MVCELYRLLFTNKEIKIECKSYNYHCPKLKSSETSLAKSDFSMKLTDLPYLDYEC